MLNSLYFFRSRLQIFTRCTFFIVTDSIQMKGAHNCVVPHIALFHGCSSTDRIQFSWDDTIFIFHAATTNISEEPIVPFQPTDGDNIFVWNATVWWTRRQFNPPLFDYSSWPTQHKHADTSWLSFWHYSSMPGFVLTQLLAQGIIKLCRTGRVSYAAPPSSALRFP